MNQTVVLIAIGLIAIVILARWLWLRRLRNRPYAGYRPLLTPAEKNFVGYLENVLEQFPHTRLCCKVRIADIVKINPLLKRKAYGRALGQVAGKHVDYCIVDARSWQPIVVLELDDKSHESLDRQQRDALVDNIFSQVNLPIIHVKAKARYSSKEIKTALLPILKSSLKNQSIE